MATNLSAPSASTANLMGSSSVNSSTKDLTTGALATNYFPDKFSRPHSPAIHNRKYRKGAPLPKIGGGREAFGAGAARMPGKNDDDYDGVDWIGASGKGKPRLRWNKFKWILFFANTLLTIYSILALVFCLLTWFNVWKDADIIRVGNMFELITSTIAAGTGIVTSLVGWSGILLNNRMFLSFYTLMLWITFALMLVPGYYTCRRREYNLEGKINQQWSRGLGAAGRLRIQNQLHCCGYFSPFVEATVSAECYARSLLPGCKGPYLKFQKNLMQRWYIGVFGLVPVHIGVILSALLCSNHVTYRFGKGMMPKAYRLDPAAMAAIIQQYASQLTDQYGGHLSDGRSLTVDTSRARGFGGGSAPSSPARTPTNGNPYGYPPAPVPGRQGSYPPQPQRQYSAPAPTPGYAQFPPAGGAGAYAPVSEEPAPYGDAYAGRPSYEYGAGGGARQRAGTGGGSRTPDVFSNANRI